MTLPACVSGLNREILSDFLKSHISYLSSVALATEDPTSLRKNFSLTVSQSLSLLASFSPILPFSHSPSPVFHRTVVPSPSYHRTVAPPYHHTVVPLYRRTFVPSHRRTAVPITFLLLWVVRLSLLFLSRVGE